MNTKIISIIPARGGSKGIPRKNVKLLAGKSLIAYTIEGALRSKYLNRVVVSTEDEEIENVSKQYGAEVIKRPAILAQDDSSTIDSVFHVLETLDLQKEKKSVVILLQPTSPLRSSEDIDNAIKLFLTNECESVISVCESGHPLYWAYKIDDKYLKPILGDSYLKMRRQNLPKSYMPNGAIYVSTVEILQEYRSFNSSKILPYMMSSMESVDIDTELDFMVAESILKMSKR